jgi:hypothetical protein
MSTRKPPERADLATRAFGVASPLGSAILLALAPKCPLCVAAYLASIGFSAGAAVCLAPLLRPALAAFAAMGLLVLLWRISRRRSPAAKCPARECC